MVPRAIVRRVQNMSSNTLLLTVHSTFFRRQYLVHSILSSFNMKYVYKSEKI